MPKKKIIPSSREFLALNLLYIRTLQGWSQERLGVECNLRRTYIGALERREVNPGIDNVDRIAQHLDVPGHLLIQDPRDAHPAFFSMIKRPKIDGMAFAGRKIDGNGKGDGRADFMGDGDSRELPRGKKTTYAGN